MNFLQKRELVEGLVGYVVREDERPRARALFEQYRDDALAVELLYTHYSMPPGREDSGVTELRLLGHRRGLFLLVACGRDEGHIYLLSSEGADYLGLMGQTEPDGALIAHFGPELVPLLQCDRQNLPVYLASSEDTAICPACHCRSGEFHELGCPVEVCPWCGGQLVRCPCRFEQLASDEIDEERLDELERLLTERGRIPFAPDQRPGFLGTGAPES